jgi:hypothetical protein
MFIFFIVKGLKVNTNKTTVTMMETASTTDTPVNFYGITRRSIPEDIFILAAVRT